MNRCSFCNLQLTDEGSVLMGYGPVCAKIRGLPWSKLGVPTLTMIPAEASRDGQLTQEEREILERVLAEDEVEDELRSE